MDNGVERSASQRAGRGRRGTADAVGAIALAEGATAQRIFVADAYDHFSVAPHNAFGDPVTQSSGADVLAQALQCEQYAEKGERVALVAPARELAAARLAMQSIAAKRLGVVFHAIADRGVADVMALADTGWGLLFASGVEDSLDLTLIARRAAEDCGTPFVVAHEVSLVKHIEPVTSPDASLCEAFVGPPSARVRRLVDPAHPMHTKVGERAFAERVPFALGSAMRELESLTGRRHDAFERSGGNDAPIMLVGLGALGDALQGEVERLRQGGHDVGAVKLTSFRPFPGARLVRVLMRALVVTVLEGSDTPLAQSNPLTRELKAAFADALTWAPEYPGVGRIPRIHSGVVGAGDHELEAHELIAIVQNMVEGDHGKRLFVLGADPELSLPPIGERPHEARAEGDFAMRGRAQDEPTAQAAAELCAAVVSSALALKARASVRPLTVADGGGFAFDLAAARERPRGVAKPPYARLIVLDDIGSLIQGNPLARLSRGGIIAVPTLQRSADALWSEMPPYVKAIAFDREARVVGFTPEAGQDPEQARWFLAAAYAGVALAVLSAPAPPGRAAIDASLVAREVGELLKTLGGADAVTCERGAAVARRAFEANVEVPRATIERDEESVRLGRRDTRATVSR